MKFRTFWHLQHANGAFYLFRNGIDGVGCKIFLLRVSVRTLPEEILDGENSDIKAVQMYLSNITKKVTFYGVFELWNRHGLQTTDSIFHLHLFDKPTLKFTYFVKILNVES
jgi:hypothetical protein